MDDPNRVNCLLADIIPKYLGELQSCKEDFPKHGRIIFSSISMVIQYLLPTLTIAVAYCQIYAQLKMRLDQKMNQLSLSVPTGDDLRKRRQSMPAVCVNRMNVNLTTTSNRRTSTVSHAVLRLEQDISRMRRTIHLLISVGMVFCICWMPLNILNTVSVKSKAYHSHIIVGIRLIYNFNRLILTVLCLSTGFRYYREVSRTETRTRI